MNFLGHIYFSNNNLDLMYANLFGDFIKGSDLSLHPNYVQDGIRLHRSIDSYIDQHPAVRELMHILYGPLPKIAGIAVDLYFDHLLAIRWDEFHTKKRSVFLDEFYSHEIKDTDFEDEHFKRVVAGIKKHKWLSYYHTTEGLTKASNTLSNRISFENKLNDAPEVFNRFNDPIVLAFEKYMEEAIPYFNSHFEKNNIPSGNNCS